MDVYNGSKTLSPMNIFVVPPPALPSLIKAWRTLNPAHLLIFNENRLKRLGMYCTCNPLHKANRLLHIRNQSCMKISMKRFSFSFSPCYIFFSFISHDIVKSDLPLVSMDLHSHRTTEYYLVVK